MWHNYLIDIVTMMRIVFGQYYTIFYAIINTLHKIVTTSIYFPKTNYFGIWSFP